MPDKEKDNRIQDLEKKLEKMTRWRDTAGNNTIYFKTKYEKSQETLDKCKKKLDEIERKIRDSEYATLNEVYDEITTFKQEIKEIKHTASKSKTKYQKIVEQLEEDTRGSFADWEHRYDISLSTIQRIRKDYGLDSIKKK